MDKLYLPYCWMVLKGKYMSEQNSAPQSAPEAAAPSAPESQSEGQLDQSPESSAPGKEAAAAPKAEEKKRLKQLQLKIDGEELLEDLPFEVDEEHAEYMKKNLQLSKKAQKSMQESANMKSQVQQFVDLLTKDTKAALKQLGIDPKQFAAQVIEEELAKEAMSPEQRELEEHKAELKRIQEERKREKDEFEKREFDRLQQQEYERIDSKMSATIEKSGLPKSAYVMKKMAQYMVDGMEMGVNLEPEDVIDLVKAEVHDDIRELVQSLGEDSVEQFIGKDVLDKIRKKNISKSKQTPAAVKAAIKDVGAKSKEAPKAQEKVDMKKFFGI
jgi:hypothetical protein